MSEDRPLRVALLGHGSRADRWASALLGRAEVSPLPELPSSAIDAVILAPGTIDPFARAREALLADVPVLYAAPFLLSPWQADVLDGLSRRQKRLLCFVEPFQYRRGFAFMQRLLEGREPFWRPLYLRSTCVVQPGHPARLDDLATEELAVCDRLLDGRPTHVIASAARRDEAGEVVAAFLTVQYSSGPVVHCTISLAEATSVRQLVAVTPERTLVMDELDPAASLRIAGGREQEAFGEGQAQRAGRENALAPAGPDVVVEEVKRFLRAVAAGERASGNSDRWVRVASVWWAARQSMSFGGQIDVPSPKLADTTPPPLTVIEGGGGSTEAGRIRPPLTVVAR